ncbi:hypothetical protein JW935_15295 [candidate division KSB1 bacterium]|nr:hypothetical protein [candidate division KSB1 bacterium]
MVTKIQYIAIIGDIVQSRQLKNREMVQVELHNFLDRINSGPFQNTIRARFVITLGDEFQGLVTRLFPLDLFLSTFESLSAGVFQTRFGVGLGEVSTPLNDQAVGMDGTCFHNARDAVNLAKKENKSVCFAGFEKNTALNALYQIVSYIQENWTERQRQVITIDQQCANHSATAKKLNISRQSVRDILNAAKYDRYIEGWKGILELLRK